jgi:hypothetical protein
MIIPNQDAQLQYRAFYQPPESSVSLDAEGRAVFHGGNMLSVDRILVHGSCVTRPGIAIND